MPVLSKIKQYINELLFGKKPEEPPKKAAPKTKEKASTNKLKVKKGKKKTKK